jgi:hypothetical protein
MKSDARNSETRDSEEEKNARVELKYCERCGGLWLRECGAGLVYCAKCQPLVAELPAPKKKPQRVMLPVGPRPAVQDYRVKAENDLEATGGAA